MRGMREVIRPIEACQAVSTVSLLQYILLVSAAVGSDSVKLAISDVKLASEVRNRCNMS